MSTEHPTKILIIDDDRHVCDLLRLVLESRDYQCVIAHNGIDGLAFAKAERPAAIILDMMMPGMNGQELLAALKRDLATANIPIMVITGLTEGDPRSDDEWKHKLGVEAYLTKPMKTDLLLSRLTDLLPERSEA